MIVVDTSALIAVLLDEPAADACRRILQTEAPLLISAATVAEALIVADSRRLRPALDLLLAGIDMEIIPVTGASATAVADAYRRWGKGNHPAKLNFGDCFAYVLAREKGAPLLYVGEDFSKTDIASALTDPAPSLPDRLA